MQQKRTNTLFLLFILNILACLLFFYPVLGDLNQVLLSNGGDGIKNYFTYLYFIKYDFATHFTGMNYPFGENIVFADNMPALAWSIAKLRTWFPGLINYGLVLMHSTFIISYFLSSFYVYKLLRLFGVQGWWLSASAVFIAYFSPQFFRLFGHFSLGLGCYFPMMIYWIMQYERKVKVKYLLYLLLGTILFTFLHVYYLGFSFVLLMAYCFSYFIIQHRPIGKKIKFCVPLLLTMVTAIFVFQLYLKITDQVIDRPKYPLGYLNGRAIGPDILTSGYNFIGHYAFLWLFGGSPSRGTEGYSYLGLVTILIVLYTLYRVIKSILFRIGKKTKIPTHPVRAYRKWLIVALVSLLFSMGIPFVWGMDFLVDYFSVFRQFRTLGRFSWIFYYLVMIYASIVLYRLFTRMRLKGYYKQYITLVASILIVWLIEWNGYGQEIRGTFARGKEFYKSFYLSQKDSWRSWLNQNGYPPEKFQGLIGLPYMHIGSEKLGAQDDYNTTMFFGAQIAYNTGLKMTDVMMSRTSWGQTFDNLRLCDGPFTPKPIIERFSNKPFLLFVSHNIPLTAGEQELLKYARYINDKEGLSLYALDIKNMEQLNLRYTDSIKSIISSIPKQEGLLYNDSSFSYANHFDNKGYPKPFISKGAYTAAAEDMHILVTVPVKHSSNDSLYIISTWFFCNNDLPDMPYIIYKQYDINNHLLDEGDYSAGRSTYVYNYWFKAQKELIIKRKTSKITLYAAGAKKSYDALDEILIQPVNSIYFYKANDTTIMLNNRPVDANN